MLSKQCLNILYPTNLLRKDIRSFMYDISNAPVAGGGIRRRVDVTYACSCISYAYATKQRYSEGGNITYTPHVQEYAGSGLGTLLPFDFETTAQMMKTVNNAIYFKCIDATSLVVNSTVFI